MIARVLRVKTIKLKITKQMENKNKKIYDQLIIRNKFQKCYKLYVIF